MMKRMGVMGGMFDPVHRGHIAAAVAALDTLSLEQLHLVPCAQPNHRAAATASGDQRLHMLSLAARADTRLVVDDRELRRPGVSYAVDTLASFAREWPDAALVFVLGWDSFVSLPGWHRWQALFDHAHFCVVSRPGVEETLSPALACEMETRRADSVEALFTRPNGGIYILDGVAVDISSTQLRDAIDRQQLDETLLPPSVAAYIQQHAIY